MTMQTADELRKSAIAYLATAREYRANEQTKVLAQMLDAMIGNYQARLLDCPDAEIQTLRISAKQLLLLRTALTAETLDRVALTV